MQHLPPAIVRLESPGLVVGNENRINGLPTVAQPDGLIIFRGVI